MTYCCTECRCLWRRHEDGTWSLFRPTEKPGACCDNPAPEDDRRVSLVTEDPFRPGPAEDDGCPMECERERIREVHRAELAKFRDALRAFVTPETGCENGPTCEDCRVCRARTLLDGPADDDGPR